MERTMIAAALGLAPVTLPFATLKLGRAKRVLLPRIHPATTDFRAPKRIHAAKRGSVQVYPSIVKMETPARPICALKRKAVRFL